MDNTKTYRRRGCWVRWRIGSRYSRAHRGEADRGDVRNGSFPLACGRWAPDGFDVDELYADEGGTRCRACSRKLDSGTW